MAKSLHQRDADELERLARIEFADLRFPERKFVRSVVLPDDIVFGPDDRQPVPANYYPWVSENSNADIARWGADREIRAKIIRWVCVDRRAKELVDPSRFLWALIGYGYKPGRAIGYSALLTIVGWALYRRAQMIPTDKEAVERFKPGSRSPSDPTNAANEDSQDPPGSPELPRHYPRFRPLVFSLENSVPLLKFGHTDKWQPDTDASLSVSTPRFSIWSTEWKPSPRFVRTFFLVQNILGWVFATLFVSAVTGLVKHKLA